MKNYFLKHKVSSNKRYLFHPLKEQEKIAQILSTWDSAIAKQKQLIVAKESVKKGLMQRLLNGEVRFKEFGGRTLVLQDKHNKTNGTKVPSPDKNNSFGVRALALQNKNKNWTKVQSPINKYKKLPHIDLLGYYQFVIFRTQDSLDDFINKIRNEKISIKEQEYKIDQYIDKSLKGCYLNDKVLDYLYNYFIDKDKKIYDLIAFCIMPNHIHILFKQNTALPKIMQQIKGATSIKINKLLNRSGKFWENNYYDKAIRDEKHFMKIYEYIKNNPIKAGLDDYKSRFYGIYE